MWGAMFLAIAKNMKVVAVHWFNKGDYTGLKGPLI